MEKPYFWDCESCDEVIERLKSFTEFSSDSPLMQFSKRNSPEGYIEKVQEFQLNFKHKGFSIAQMPFQIFTRKNGLRQQIMYLAIVERWENQKNES